jgi:hypothetical protein
MAASTSTKKGCGCGGGGSSAPASPCNCGGASCSLCQDQGYVRPRFFAGQLLTEDDLQQLEDYGVAKNRLHMRQLFGAGVVCGLEVTCYPCGGGKVIVNPGYALDCCGNDIVVSCSTELDINQMVRELLRKQRGGFDCGDPCADATKPATSPNDPASATQPAMASGTGGATTTQPASHGHKYCLYINYCEQPSDPVSPYATDDPCGTTSCETTRIREGFSFELRCPPVPTAPRGICGSIKDCLGDQTAFATVSSSNDRLGMYVQKYDAAYAQVQKTPIREMGQTFFDDWQTHVKDLLDATKLAASKPQALVDASVNLASDLAIYMTQANPPAAAKSVGKEAKDINDLVGQTNGALVAAFAEFAKSEFVDQYTDSLDLAFTRAIADVTNPLLKFASQSAPGRPDITGADRPVHEAPPASNLLPRLVGATGQVQDFFVQMLAYKAPYSSAFHNEAISRLEAMDLWIANRFAQSQSKTHCAMPELTRLPPAVAGDVASAQFVSLIRRAPYSINTFVSLLRDCICNAINPPCPDCNDMGVLLACITVKDCQVVDICNLERTFVLTWPTMRYWIPEIGQLGNAIEKICCPSLCEEDLGTVGRLRTVGTDPAAAYGQILLSLMTTGCGIRVPIEPVQSNPFTGNLRAQVLGSLREFAEARATVVSQSQGPGTQTKPSIEPSTVHEFNGKLKTTQQNFDQLSREHRRLLDRVARLEKALGKKGGNPDA